MHASLQQVCLQVSVAHWAGAGVQLGATTKGQAGNLALGLDLHVSSAELLLGRHTTPIHGVVRASNMYITLQSDWHLSEQHAERYWRQYTFAAV